MFPQYATTNVTIPLGTIAGVKPLGIVGAYPWYIGGLVICAFNLNSDGNVSITVRNTSGSDISTKFSVEVLYIAS